MTAAVGTVCTCCDDTKDCIAHTMPRRAHTHTHAHNCAPAARRRGASSACWRAAAAVGPAAVAVPVRRPRSGALAAAVPLARPPVPPRPVAVAGSVPGPGRRGRQLGGRRRRGLALQHQHELHAATTPTFFSLKYCPCSRATPGLDSRIFT